MSTIPFNYLPENLRVPLFYAEVDNSRANSAVAIQRTLIIGQITSAGAATPNVPILSQGLGDAAVQGGPDSILALLTAAYRKNDTFGEVWYLPVADAGGAQAATGSLQFTAQASANGTLNLYVAGVRYQLPISSVDTTPTLAAALAALLNADAACPVNATVSTSTVTFTAVNKGLVGNDIDIRVNYLGASGGEETPAGLTFTITAMSGGTTNPTLTTALSNLSDKGFDFIVCPYSDTASLDALKAFLNDQAGRWSWNAQIYGHTFFAHRGTVGALTTFGLARNDAHASGMGLNGSPTPDWIWAAAITGAVAPSLRNDPGRPLQTLPVQGVLAPPLPQRFNLQERNSLLFSGISTFTVDDDGTVRIDNLITTYQKNAFGSPDDSYLQVETLFLLAYVLRSLRAVVTSKYARVKLVADGTRFAPGAAAVTPNMIRGDLIAHYRQLEFLGMVQGADQFKRELIVRKSDTNPNRVDVLWPGILVNQLRIFALLAQFRLQVDAVPA